MTSQAHIAPWAEIVPGVGPLTADDLLTLPDDGWQYEVVNVVELRRPHVLLRRECRRNGTLS